MEGSKEEIIINGNGLKFTQKLLFNQSGYVIRKWIVWVLVFIGALFMAIEVYFIANKMAPEAGLFAILIIFYMQNIERLISGKIFINHGGAISDDSNSIAQALRNSWILTSDMVEELLSTPLYIEGEERIKILKNSSGHKVIDDLKTRAAYDVPEMVTQIKNPEIYLVNSVMGIYYEKGQIVKMHKDFEFRDKSLANLQLLYTTANGIVANNNFSKRAIKTKSKEELVKFFENRFKESLGC